jgi:hypothetical protein
MTATYPYDDLHIISPHLSTGWLHNRQIAVFVPQNAGRMTMESWAEAVRQCYEAWPKGQPCLTLQDFSNPNVVMTAHSRQKMNELALVRPEMTRYIAVLTSKTQFTTLVAYAIAHIANPHVRKMQVFFKRQNAIDWLLERRA